MYSWTHNRMSKKVDDVMRLCCELSANQQIKTTVKGSSKGAVAAGGLAFAGGLVGGPLGIAVGEWTFLIISVSDLDNGKIPPFQVICARHGLGRTSESEFGFIAMYVFTTRNLLWLEDAYNKRIHTCSLL